MLKNNKTNITKVEDGKIFKIQTSKTSGSQNTKGQVFYSNFHLNHKSSKCEPIEFSAPKYSAITTGTLSLVGQDSMSVFELYGRPELSFSFSANTESFTGSQYAYMSHDIYKIPYGDIVKYRQDPSSINYDVVAEKLNNPFLTFSAATAVTSSIISTGDVYTFSSEQIDKPIRGLSEEIFEDKATYFFNTKHSFNRVLNSYNDIKDVNGKRISYKKENQFTTFGDVQAIKSGAWSGMTAKGLFFTCFYPPSMPQIENPRPESYSASSFTPQFFFSNVSDGDAYVVDITYQAPNSGFTIQSATSKYYFFKEETSVGTQRRATQEKTSFLSETTRRVSVPLIPDSTYWYRIGNIKEVINIFDMRQQIITYTDSYIAQSFSGQNVTYLMDSSATRTPPQEDDGGSGNQSGQFSGIPPETPGR